MIGVALEAAMLILVLSHFCLTLLHGYTDPNYSDPEHKIINSSWDEITKDPSILKNDPKNKNFMLFLLLLIGGYITPLAIAIAFTWQAGDIEESLIPVAHLFEQSPGTMFEHLRESILLPEKIARDILGSGRMDEFITQAEVAEAVKAEALSYGSVYKLGVIGAGNEQDLEKEELGETSNSKTVDSKGQITLKHLLEQNPRNLLDLIFDRWWPLHLILKNNPSDKYIWTRFEPIWIIHCSLVMVVIAQTLYLTLYGMVKLILRLNFDPTHPDGADATMALYYLSLSVPLAIFLGTFLFVLGQHACVVYTEALRVVAERAQNIAEMVNDNLKKAASQLDRGGQASQES